MGAKRVKHRLLEAEERYRTLVEQLPVAVYIDALDERSSNIYTSPQLEQILGYAVDEWQSDPDLFVRALHPDDRERVLAESRAANESGEPFLSEYRLIARDGRVVWLRDEAVVVRDREGHPLHSQGYLLDISDRRATEEALRGREALLAAVARVAGELVRATAWREADILAPLGEAVGASRAYVVEHVARDGAPERVATWAADGVEPLVDATLGDLVCMDDDFARVRELLAAGTPVAGPVGPFQAGERAELERRGIRAFLVVPVMVEDEWWGFVGFDDCVSERDWSDSAIGALRVAANVLGAAIRRERADRSLQLSEARFAAFMNTTQAVAFMKDDQGRYVYANEPMERAFDLEPGWIIGRTDADFLAEANARELRATDDIVRETGRQVERLERAVAQDGTMRHWLALKFPFEDPSGGRYVGGVSLDVSDRERASHALAESTAALEALVATAPLAVITSDRAGNLTRWNAEAERMLGWKAEEVLGRPPQHFVPGDSDGPDSRARAQAGEAVADAEGRRLCRDGSIVDVRYAKAPLRGASGEVVGMIAILTDVTERKRADERLRQTTETLEAIVGSSPLAIMTFDAAGHVMGWNQAAERTFGYTTEEAVGSFNPILPEGEEERFTRTVGRAREGRSWRDVEVRRRRKDGVVIDVSAASAPLRDVDGKAVGMVAMLTDISERKRAETRLAAQHEVTRVLAASATVAEAAPAVLEAVAEGLGWDVAGLWLADRGAGVLRCAALRHRPSGNGAFESFVHGSEAASFEPQVGLAGRVWEAGEPAWVRDVSVDTGFVRLREAAAAGLHAGFAAPVTAGGEALGVLELFSRETRDRDPDLVDILTSIGRQVGEFVRRVEADAAVREREERLRTLVSNLPGVVYRCGAAPDWTMDFMSDEILEATGYPASDFFGSAVRRYGSIIHPEDRPWVVRLVDEAVEGQDPFQLEYRILHADGSVRWVAERGQPVAGPDGKVLWLDGVIFDVTERKEAEAERERLLAAEQAALGQAEAARAQLAEQNQALRELDRMKDEFVAVVSHELRTPLTSILGYLELVLAGDAGEVTDDQQHFLAIIERNAQRLLRLVGDLLFVAQIEAGRLSVERDAVDLLALVRDCLEAARPGAQEKGLVLASEAEAVPGFTGDRTRLAQVLDNLVSNAIKFTPEGGRIDVRLARDGSDALLTVSDTGMGIAAGDRARLFERFFRSPDATERAIQGTGLGLTITKAIVEAHGGTIAVASEEGTGTTFTVRLPLAGAPDTHGPRSRRTSPTQTGASP